MSCISEVLYADIFFLHQTITFVTSFYLAIVMVSVICWFGMQEENARPGVIYAFDLMLDISSYRKLMMLFATIPFGTVYCRERNTKWQILFCIVPLCQSICQFIW